GLELFLPLLLLGAYALKGQVPDFLSPGIQFAQFSEGIGLAFDHPVGLLGDLTVPAHEAFSLVVPSPSGLLPELVGVGDFRTAIEKAYLRFVVLLRRHVTFALKGGHIVPVQLIPASLLFRLAVLRHVRG